MDRASACFLDSEHASSNELGQGLLEGEGTIASRDRDFLMEMLESILANMLTGPVPDDQ